MTDRPGIVVLRTGDGASKRDLLEACEATFNIDIERCEAEPLRTVGDLYGVIRWKCQNDGPGPSAGTIAECYRQLRTHLIGRGVRRPIRPSSPLEAVLGPAPRTDWALLRRQCGGRLPRLELSNGQLIFTTMLVAAGLAGGVFGGLTMSDMTGNQSLGVVTGLAVLGVMLLVVMAYGLLFARAIPGGLRTMADLARHVASGRAGARAGRKPPVLWDALEDVIRRDGGFEGPVTADLAIELPKKASAG
jgi:hypothetical protein